VIVNNKTCVTKRVINKSHMTKQGCAVPPHVLYKLFLLYIIIDIITIVLASSDPI